MAALLPLLVLATWARLEPVAAWEAEIASALVLPEGPLGVLLGALSTLGDLGAWALLVLAICLVAVVRGRTWAALLVGLTLVADLAGTLVKLAVERERPEGVLVEHLLGEDSFAFPSGHVLRATALAAVLVWLLSPPPLRLPLAVAGGVAGGTIMGYARIALGVHWPSDVVGGVLLGIGWFAVTGWLLGRRIEAARIG